VIVGENRHEGPLARQPSAHVRVATQYERIHWQVCCCRQQTHMVATAFGILDEELRDRL
jgi:hypothetical protein